MKQILEVRLKGALLLGGGSDSGSLNATLRRADGLPYIPASALKGAIREQLQRLVGQADADTILGREGHAARLDGSSTGVFLSDAVPADARAATRFRVGHGYALRTQVSIERRTRRAADELLFTREVVAPLGDTLVFHAEADTTALDDPQRRLLQAAASAVFGLGAGRSGGLGVVEMALLPAGGATPSPVVIPEADAVDLLLEAEDPLCLGEGRWMGNFHASLDHIPAAALRGALVAAALRQRGETRDLTGDPAFGRLFLDPETALRFSDGVPVAPGHEAPLPRRAPFSRRVCKPAPAHRAVDALVGGFLLRWLGEHGHAVAASDTCPDCGAPTRAADGWLGGVPPGQRVVTRVGLDPLFARAADEQLFSLELIERDTPFLARVSNLDDDGRAYVRDAAAHGLRVGHGRGQGYGRVRVLAARPARPTDGGLQERLARFDEATRTLLADAARWAGVAAPEGFHLAATLTSDLVPQAAPRGAVEALHATLALPEAEVLAAHVRTAQRGGFDTRTGAPKPLQGVVAAGSTLLLRLPHPAGDELRARLTRAERHGLGARREEGFGSVRFSDPLHLPTGGPA